MSMRRDMTSAEIESALRDYFAEHAEGLVAAYLFGSQARGTATSASDVDVGVLFETSPPHTLQGLPLGLEAELEKLLGRPVQVVVLNHVSADLAHRVLRDGKLLVDRDRSRRIRFEVKTRNDFFDLQPVLREYRFPRAITP